MRKFPILLAILVSSISVFGQKIEKNFNTFIQDSELKNAQIGFSMVTLKTGKLLYSYQANKSLSTASTLKLITTSSALELLGADHTFQTKLLLRGTIIDGVLHGDIIIRGEGDPIFNSQEFLKHYGDVFSQWTSAIQTLGIKKIQGQIIGDDTYFEGPSLVGSTGVKDIGNYYGAGAHALSTYENMYSIYFSSPNQPDKEVEIRRITPPDVLKTITLKNEVKSSKENKDNAYIFGIPDSDIQIIRGTIPMNKKSFKIKGSIPDPAKLLAFQLKEALISLAIPVTGETISYLPITPQHDYSPNDLQVIHTFVSPPLSEIVKYTNYHSSNTIANNLIKNIGKQASNEGSYQAGISAIKEYWSNKGIDTAGWFQEDGSGLSRANAITSEQLTSVIASVSQANRTILQEGLKDFGKSNRRIITKSGYMNRVRSFAGYMTLKDGREVAFSLIANNYSCSASSMRRKIEAFLLGI